MISTYVVKHVKLPCMISTYVVKHVKLPCMISTYVVKHVKLPGMISTYLIKHVKLPCMISTYVVKHVNNETTKELYHKNNKTKVINIQYYENTEQMTRSLVPRVIVTRSLVRRVILSSINANISMMTKGMSKLI